MSKPLKLEISKFFAQAQLFYLDQQEVKYYTSKWENEHGAPQVQALLREVDPGRIVFKYVLSPDEDIKPLLEWMYKEIKLGALSLTEILSRFSAIVGLEEGESIHAKLQSVDPRRMTYPWEVDLTDPLWVKLTPIFLEAKSEKLSSETINRKVYTLISDGQYNADQVVGMMSLVDPGREVFDYPIKPWDRGIHGYPMQINRFESCSDTYGHRLLGSEHISAEFTNACEVLWEDGVLYDHGGLAVDRKTLKGGYAVEVGMGHRIKPSPDDLLALGAKHGLNFEVCSQLLKQDPKHFGSSLVMVALVTDIQKLPQVPSISADMQDVADKWERNWKRQQAQDVGNEGP